MDERIEGGQKLASDTNNFTDTPSCGDVKGKSEPDTVGQIVEAAKPKDTPRLSNKNKNGNDSTPVFKDFFSNTPFQINAIPICENEDSIDFKINTWCDDQTKPKEMMQLAQITITGNDEPQFWGAEQPSQILIDFSNIAVKRLRKEGILKKVKESKATLFICHSLWNTFNIPLEVRDKPTSENLPPVPEEAQVLPESYEDLIKEMLVLPRREGLSLAAQWVEKNGTYEEGREFEVRGSARTNLLKSQDEKFIPQKKSLGADNKGRFRLQYREGGKIKTERLGRNLPPDFDFSQVTISPSARQLLGI